MFRRAVAFTAEIEFDILRDTRSRRLAVYTRTGITFLIKEKKKSNGENTVHVNKCDHKQKRIIKRKNRMRGNR